MHTVSHYLHTASVQHHCFGLDWQINDGDLISNLIAESIQFNQLALLPEARWILMIYFFLFHRQCRVGPGVICNS